MSLTNAQEEILEDLREDFDFFLSQEKWSDCEAVIKSISEFHQEVEVDQLRKTLYGAQIGAQIQSEADGKEYDADDFRPEYPKV